QGFGDIPRGTIPVGHQLQSVPLEEGLAREGPHEFVADGCIGRGCPGMGGDYLVCTAEVASDQQVALAVTPRGVHQRTPGVILDHGGLPGSIAGSLLGRLSQMGVLGKYRNQKEKRHQHSGKNRQLGECLPRLRVAFQGDCPPAANSAGRIAARSIGPPTVNARVDTWIPTLPGAGAASRISASTSCRDSSYTEVIVET